MLVCKSFCVSLVNQLHVHQTRVIEGLADSEDTERSALDSCIYSLVDHF